MTPESTLFSAFRENRYTLDGILRNPLKFKGWSLQGFGMLRLYLTKDIRLHVWDVTKQVDNVSLIHDHPWDFRSLVVYGHIENKIYTSLANGGLYEYATIQCGPGGGARSETQEILLEQWKSQHLYAGQSYRQISNEIHASYPDSGTVTLVERYFKPDTEHARVFWPKGEKWVSAEPRPATAKEITSICGNVSKLWK